METRPMGQSKVALSAVGLGGFELGPEPGEEPDIARGTALIEAALETGINWLDTSENYLETRNESLIGAAPCADRRRDPRSEQGGAWSRRHGGRQRLPP